MVGGWDGLIGYKANLSPAKLKLADIGLELSLAIYIVYIPACKLENNNK